MPVVGGVLLLSVVVIAAVCIAKRYYCTILTRTHTIHTLSVDELSASYRKREEEGVEIQSPSPTHEDAETRRWNEASSFSEEDEPTGPSVMAVTADKDTE